MRRMREWAAKQFGKQKALFFCVRDVVSFLFYFHVLSPIATSERRVCSLSSTTFNSVPALLSPASNGLALPGGWLFWSWQIACPNQISEMPPTRPTATLGRRQSSEASPFSGFIITATGLHLEDRVYPCYPFLLLGPSKTSHAKLKHPKSTGHAP